MRKQTHATLSASEVPASHYNHAYSSKGRFAAYWHQIDEVLAFKSSSVLEIGIGNSTTTGLLRREGVYVVGMDINDKLRPNLLGSVDAIPIRTSAVDVVLCCQVLEHLPWDAFKTVLAELWRVAAKGVVMSLPDRTRCITLSTTLDRKASISKVIDLPQIPWRPLGADHMDVEHLWEIGCSGLTAADVMAAIRGVTGQMARTYRVVEFPYHRFFVFAKPSET